MGKLLVVNLFGGPGAGKSTISADVFAELKWAGINCELVTEFAKDKVWEGSERVLENQIYVFGEQSQRLHRLIGKVDVVVTDSPLLLSIHYNKLGRAWTCLDSIVTEAFQEFENMNYLVERKKDYNQAGRMQTEEEAIVIDSDIKVMLESKGFEYWEIPGNRRSVDTIFNDVIERLEAKKAEEKSNPVHIKGVDTLIQYGHTLNTMVAPVVVDTVLKIVG